MCGPCGPRLRASAKFKRVELFKMSLDLAHINLERQPEHPPFCLGSSLESSSFSLTVGNSDCVAVVCGLTSGKTDDVVYV